MSKKKQKRQFVGTAKPRLFFDRRVRPTGSTLSISLGKFIPATWSYVRIELVDREDDAVTIRISKLLERPIDACGNTADTGSEQDT